MQVTEGLARQESPRLDGMNASERVEALLPTSGISIGPPSAEDRVEISPLAHALTRMNQRLAELEVDHVNALRMHYIQGSYEVEAENLARAMLRTFSIADVSRLSSAANDEVFDEIADPSDSPLRTRWRTFQNRVALADESGRVDQFESLGPVLAARR